MEALPVIDADVSLVPLAKLSKLLPGDMRGGDQETKERDEKEGKDASMRGNILVSNHFNTAEKDGPLRHVLGWLTHILQKSACKLMERSIVTSKFITG